MPKRKIDQLTTSIQLLPESLRQLAQKFDDFDEFKVASDIAHEAAALIAKAWDGSLYEDIFKRKIPLTEAIKCSAGALDTAMASFIPSYAKDMYLMAGAGFQVVKFVRDVKVAFENLKNLEFANLGAVHFEHIQAALTNDKEAWCRGPWKDEVFIVEQFSVRMTEISSSFKERTGKWIESGTNETSIQEEDPYTPLVYNAVAGRIYGGPNWSNFGEGPFDWARLFGPKTDDDQEEEDEDGPWLTPRMAARLHYVAVLDGDTMISNWEDYKDAPKLPKIARTFFKQSKEWRESFRECYFRIAMRLEKGLPPESNCTGEELALDNILNSAGDFYFDEMMDDEDDGILKGLPRFPNDDDFSLVGDIAVQDQDVLMLYEKGDNGYSDSEDEECSPLGKRASFMLGDGAQFMDVVYLHPSEWFIAFKNDKFRNHLPGVAS